MAKKLAASTWVFLPTKKGAHFLSEHPYHKD